MKTPQSLNNIFKHNERCAFLLLGNFAKENMKIINDNNRCGVHPSPLSANRRFLNSTIFRDLESCLSRKIHQTHKIIIMYFMYFIQDMICHILPQNHMYQHHLNYHKICTICYISYEIYHIYHISFLHHIFLYKYNILTLD